MTDGDHQAAPDRQRPLLVLLAAGAGSRFSGPVHKLNATIGEATVLQHAIAAAQRADVGDVAVVVGAAPVAMIPPDVAVVNNPRWRLGQATSLWAVVTFARTRHYPALVVALGDQPEITPACWRAVARSSAPIAFASYGGKRGHPVRLDARVWDELPRTGDTGARELIRSSQYPAHAIACGGSTRDIDTVKDLTWQKYSLTNSRSTDRSTKPGR